MFDFHPLIGDWFDRRFDEPTEPRGVPLPHIRSMVRTGDTAASERVDVLGSAETKTGETYPVPPDLATLRR